MGALLPFLLDYLKKGKRKNAALVILVVTMIFVGIYIERASAWQSQVNERLDKYDKILYLVIDLHRGQRAIEKKLNIKRKRRDLSEGEQKMIRDFEVQELLENATPQGRPIRPEPKDE